MPAADVCNPNFKWGVDETEGEAANDPLDVVVDEDPYNQMMDVDNKMVKSAGNTMPAANVCSPQFKSGFNEIDGEAANDPVHKDDDNEITTEKASITEIF